MAKLFKHRIRTQFYPNSMNYKLFIAKCFLEQKSQSEFGLKVFKEYFNKKDKSELAYLLSVFDNMTPEERKNPKKRPN